MREGPEGEGMNTVKTMLKDCRNISGESLFLLGYMIYLGRAVWTSTMFPFPGRISTLCLLSAMVLITLKIVFFDRYPVTLLFGIIALVLCAGGVLALGHYMNAVFWLLVVMGSKDVDFGKMLKSYLLVAGTIVFLAFWSSIIGIIENLRYHGGRGIRNSFGIIYTTDFAAYIFFLLLIYFYLKGPALRVYHYLGAAVLSGVVYYFCRARVDSICILMVAVVFGIHGFLEHTQYALPRVRRGWRWIWRTFGLFSIPFWAAMSVAVTYYFKEENALLVWLDKWFSNRLTLGKQGLDEFGFTLFGQTVEMNGNGGSTEWPENYFFIDCSYVHVLLRFGVVFLLILVSAYVVCCWRNRCDIYFLFAIALVAINCVIAHHILEVSYNPFAYALLTVPLGRAAADSLLWKDTGGRNG